MNFEYLLREIEELKGRWLSPIGSAAEIQVVEVDREAELVRILVRGRRDNTRSFDELNKVWTVLKNSPTAHVDTVLAGSGTSRNQPETLLANLPFIEYLVVKGRKHLALVNENTHEAATIRRMDALAAEVRRQAVLAATPRRPRVVISSKTVGASANQLCEAMEVESEPIKGGYRLYFRDFDIDVLPASPVLAPGMYLVLSGRPFSGDPICVGGENYDLIALCGLRAIFPID